MDTEVERLKREIARLQRKIVELQYRLSRTDVTVPTVLKQKGFTLDQFNPAKGILLPRDADAGTEANFYRLMSRYSFRLFLRDLIAHRDRFSEKDLIRYCTARTASNYLSMLTETGIILKLDDAVYALKDRAIQSIGPTLEWYIAQVFMREFDSAAIYGVKLKNTVHGGDYDVIAWLDNRLVYTEVKSSPPRGIEAGDVRAFYQRLSDLTPDLAFFLVDTELRMKDKIVPLFEEERRRIHGTEPHDPILRIKDELFQLDANLFIMNSKKGIPTGFKTCIRQYQRREFRVKHDRSG